MTCDGNFRGLLTDAQTDPSLRFDKVVHVLPGVNHGQYTTGVRPPNLANDLPSLISDEEARAIIANASALFIDYISRVSVNLRLSIASK